jgi:ubiquinone/menaquinone biosynthesis C-methylase UbiE
VLDLLECPECREGALHDRADGGGLACAACGATFPVRSGVACFQDRFDAYSENYDRICEDDLLEPKTPAVVKQIFTELVLERAAGTVCDLGCGDGYVIRRVASERRIAVDIAFPYLERLEPSITRLWARVEQVPLGTASVDTVVCTDVLEHVLDAEALAREIARLVRPGGCALLAFPFEQDLSVYDLPEYRRKYGKYAFVHLRSVTDALVAELFPGFERRHERLITEGMPLMEFEPFAIKFVELRRLACAA